MAIKWREHQCPVCANRTLKRKCCTGEGQEEKTFEGSTTVGCKDFNDTSMDFKNWAMSAVYLKFNEYKDSFKYLDSLYLNDHKLTDTDLFSYIHWFLYYLRRAGQHYGKKLSVEDRYRAMFSPFIYPDQVNNEMFDEVGELVYEAMDNIIRRAKKKGIEIRQRSRPLWAGATGFE